MINHLEKARMACDLAKKISVVLGGTPNEYMKVSWNLVKQKYGDNKSLKGGDESKVVK